MSTTYNRPPRITAENAEIFITSFIRLPACHSIIPVMLAFEMVLLSYKLPYITHTTVLPRTNDASVAGSSVRSTREYKKFSLPETIEIEFDVSSEGYSLGNSS